MLTRCHKDCHVNGCRYHRPKCKVMRRKNPQTRVCNCHAAHFPHRKGWCAAGNTAYGPQL